MPGAQQANILELIKSLRSIQDEEQLKLNNTNRASGNGMHVQQSTPAQTEEVKGR